MSRYDEKMSESRFNEIRESLAEMNPDALLADGFEKALIGYTANQHHATVAVYSLKLCRRVLMNRDGMSHEEADEYLSFNTLGAYVGENGPLFVEVPW